HGGGAAARRSRWARNLACGAEQDPGIARGGPVQIRLSRDRAGGHGDGAGGWHRADRRRLEVGRPLRSRRGRDAVPGAQGVAARNYELAGGDLRSGVDDGGGVGDVFGPPQTTGRDGTAVGGTLGPNAEVTKPRQ